VRAPLDPATSDRTLSIIAGEPFTPELVGPSSTVWGRGDGDYGHGHVAYVATDGGETLQLPDGIVRPAQVLPIEFDANTDSTNTRKQDR
jgi:hypothetical protein